MTSLHVICGLAPPIKNPGYAYAWDVVSNFSGSWAAITTTNSRADSANQAELIRNRFSFALRHHGNSIGRRLRIKSPWSCHQVQKVCVKCYLQLHIKSTALLPAVFTY